MPRSRSASRVGSAAWAPTTRPRGTRRCFAASSTRPCGAWRPAAARSPRSCEGRARRRDRHEPRHRDERPDRARRDRRIREACHALGPSSSWAATSTSAPSVPDVPRRRLLGAPRAVYFAATARRRGGGRLRRRARLRRNRGVAPTIAGSRSDESHYPMRRVRSTRGAAAPGASSTKRGTSGDAHRLHSRPRACRPVTSLASLVAPSLLVGAGRRPTRGSARSVVLQPSGDAHAAAVRTNPVVRGSMPRTATDRDLGNPRNPRRADFSEGQTPAARARARRGSRPRARRPR